MSKDNKVGTNTNMLLAFLFFVATDCASPLYTLVDAHGDVMSLEATSVFPQRGRDDAA